MEQPALNRLPAPLAQESIVACDGRSHDAQVNTNYLLG
jgi:hypothetical protein